MKELCSPCKANFTLMTVRYERKPQVAVTNSTHYNDKISPPALRLKLERLGIFEIGHIIQLLIFIHWHLKIHFPVTISTHYNDKISPLALRLKWERLGIFKIRTIRQLLNCMNWHWKKHLPVINSSHFGMIYIPL